MKKDWEILYEHAKAVRDSQAESVGISLPEQEEYGTLRVIPNLYRKFNGAKFWEIFKSKSHDNMDQGRCVCNKQARMI